ncbi:hypothetical protein [Caballeronia sordidicola]|uniref:Uncharacterized protein n=1 Tax=Caballeronia sordidicola TaxID=196367 RepID=A0A226X6W1_CABSO|nr:hypothetical protein [Caballeronia sordidicola]OXC79174.1 hypothetical protein BSU04_08370 [Caballeronia sordidicola]
MFKPFANDTDTLNINGDALVIANDTARLSISGDLEIVRDKTGLTTALVLQKAVNAIVDALQNDAGLPEKLADEPPKPADKTDNPFI